MDTVLGVAMAPAAVRMVLVEGENGDGATVDEDNFAVSPDTEATAAADQVISAILGTREGAAEGGYQLAATGVAWTDPVEAAALRDALAAHKIENVMLVSAFLAAAALTHAVGSQTDYSQTALLFIEPDTATLAIVDTADGSIGDIDRQLLPEDDEAAVAQLATMVSSIEALETRPEGVFVVGSGIDIPMIKPALDAATSLPVTAPEEPDTALARGAALASAHAPLFAASTAGRAYAQDPGTGAMDPFALPPSYFDTPAADATDNGLAYSAVPDDLADAYTEVVTAPAEQREAGSFTLLGSSLAAIFVIGVAALVISLAVTIRPTAGVQPDPGQELVAPAQPAPAATAPVAPAPEAPAPAPAAPAPAPAPVAQVPAPVPQAPVPAAVPVPEAPAPAPIPVPQAPAPVAPIAPLPAAPIPVPIPIPLPILAPQAPIPGPQLPFGPGGGPGFGGGHGGGHGRR